MRYKILRIEKLIAKKPETNKPTEKMILDQTNKQRYFLQNRDLKFCLRHGIRVFVIHTVIHLGIRRG